VRVERKLGKVGRKKSFVRAGWEEEEVVSEVEKGGRRDAHQLSEDC
jgi:hypothetical protein